MTVVHGGSCPLCLNNHYLSAPLPDPNLSFTTTASTAGFNQILPLFIIRHKYFRLSSVHRDADTNPTGFGNGVEWKALDKD